MTEQPLDDIPAFCIIPADVRRAAWERNPPKAMPTFQTMPALDADTEAFRARQDELRRTKTSNRIGAMKAKQAIPIDLSRHRWDSRNNRFVPLTPEELASVRSRKASKKGR